MYITNLSVTSKKVDLSPNIEKKMNACQIVPFLKFWRREESCEVCGGVVHLSLPPVWILLINNLNDVTRLEFQAGFFARDKFIFDRVIVKLCSHIRLQIHYLKKHYSLIKPLYALHKDDLSANN